MNDNLLNEQKNSRRVEQKQQFVKKVLFVLQHWNRLRYVSKKERERNILITTIKCFSDIIFLTNLERWLFRKRYCGQKF
jgi:hypothetical protein